MILVSCVVLPVSSVKCNRRQPRDTCVVIRDTNIVCRDTKLAGSKSCIRLLSQHRTVRPKWR